MEAMRKAWLRLKMLVQPHIQIPRTGPTRHGAGQCQLARYDLLLTWIDANDHGIMSREDCLVWNDGICLGWCVRSLHGICKLTNPSNDGRASNLRVLPVTNLMLQMSYDTPMTPEGRAMGNLPLKEQLRKGFKDMGQRSLSSAKNFGKVGAIFAGTECCIEGYRAKNVLSNGIIAGCITGGVLAAPAGPQAAALGCGGFAAFSAAIDAYMRQPKED